MKHLATLLIAALFIALPLASAYHYAPQPAYRDTYYGGADTVFRGEVTRVQRISGSDPRFEITFRVRERIKGYASSTIRITEPRSYRAYYDSTHWQEDMEYVVGVRRSNNQYRPVWYEPVMYYYPPAYRQPQYASPYFRPTTGVTIPNPHTTDTCSVVEISGQVVVVCPNQAQQPSQPSRLEPLAIGQPKPRVITAPRVPIAAFPWLH